jgi:hypothetical protein
VNRRGFLRNLTGGIVAAAAVRTFPFRVYSFPTDVVLAPADTLASMDALMAYITTKVKRENAAFSAHKKAGFRSASWERKGLISTARVILTDEYGKEVNPFDWSRV